MIKYYDTLLVFQEVPDEITLAINISNCPHRCPNCHSPELREDIGTELTYDELDKLISEHKHITCVCFMGGDSSHQDIYSLAAYIHQEYPKIKTAMYSGNKEIDPLLVSILDYYKVGPYLEDYGPLDSPTTNQRFYKVEVDHLVDITYRFQEK